MSSQRRTSSGIGGYGNRVLISDLQAAAPSEAPTKIVAASTPTRYGIGGAGNVVNAGDLLPSSPRSSAPPSSRMRMSSGIGGYGNIRRVSDMPTSSPASSNISVADNVSIRSATFFRRYFVRDSTSQRPQVWEKSMEDD